MLGNVRQSALLLALCRVSLNVTLDVVLRLASVAFVISDDVLIARF